MIKRIDKKVNMSTEAAVIGADKLSHMQLEVASRKAIEDKEYWRLIKELRNDPGKGWTKERSMRRVAHIPAPLYYKAIKLYGEDVFKDKKKFKKYFCKDEVGKWTLTVPENTL